MAGKKGMLHYGTYIIAKVLALREEGLTYREIGEAYGKSSEQIRDLLRRHRKSESQRVAGIKSKAKGRPRKMPLTALRESELRIKELEREVALLRSFLHAAGRR